MGTEKASDFQMITGKTFTDVALSFPKALAKPHFDRTAFKVEIRGGKTFATLAADKLSANLVLTLEQQEILYGAEPDVFSPVPNKWGEKGWTTMTFASADDRTLKSALRMAWLNAAPEKIHSELDQ